MKKIYRFTASWCQPCKALASVIGEINSPIPIEVIDIDSDPQMANKFAIRSVPTLVMVEHDTEIKRMSGLRARNLVEEWIGTV